MRTCQPLPTQHTPGQVQIQRQWPIPRPWTSLFQVNLKAERKRKEIIKHFKNHGLAITIQSNLHIVNFLDATLNPTNGSYCPYRKPNTTQYIDARSNQPPSILKQPPSAINRRISGISCKKKSFDKAKQHYEDALKRSGHNKFHLHSQWHFPTPTKYSVTPPQELTKKDHLFQPSLQ